MDKNQAVHTLMIPAEFQGHHTTHQIPTLLVQDIFSSRVGTPSSMEPQYGVSKNSGSSKRIPTMQTPTEIMYFKRKEKDAKNAKK